MTPRVHFTSLKFENVLVLHNLQRPHQQPFMATDRAVLTRGGAVASGCGGGKHGWMLACLLFARTAASLQQVASRFRPHKPGGLGPFFFFFSFFFFLFFFEKKKNQRWATPYSSCPCIAGGLNCSSAASARPPAADPGRRLTHERRACRAAAGAEPRGSPSDSSPDVLPWRAIEARACNARAGLRFASSHPHAPAR